MGGAIIGGLGGFVVGIIAWQLLFGPKGHFEAPDWWVTDSVGRPVAGFLVLVACMIAGIAVGSAAGG